MSIERLERQGGVVWRVRWREGGQNKAKVLGRKRDAEAFDADIRRRKRAGELVDSAGAQMTVAELAREWWQMYGEPNLARSTLQTYAIMWDRHVLPRIGGLRLRELTPQALERFRGELAAAGVGLPPQRRVLVVLQGILQRAVEWGYIPTNPAKVVRKPAGRRRHVVRPMTPMVVERMRSHLLDRGDARSATLVSVLAYAGLRPGEALALRFGDLQERTILVEQAVSLGEVKDTKTGRLRAVRLLPALADDLSAWQAASDRPSDDALVFPAAHGGLWSPHDWKNWVRRRFRPAAAAAGIERARPYDLRHSFCSLLLYEGRTIVEVARQAGHAPSMSLDTYQHVIDELDGADRVPADEQIRRARAELVPVSYPLSIPPMPSDAATRVNPLLIGTSRRPDSNRGPLHYERHQRVERLTVRVHERHQLARYAGVSGCRDVVGRFGLRTG
jgi:integrase